MATLKKQRRIDTDNRIKAAAVEVFAEYGYERAKRFINEMNKKLNANLSTNRIDEIMSKDYKDVKKLIK